MSRKNPHLNAEGQPKHGYRTAAAGWARIRHLADTGRVAEGILHACPCRTCKQFHIGKNHSTAPHRRGRTGTW